MNDRGRDWVVILILAGVLFLVIVGVVIPILDGR